jgi:hypothetical protein
MDAKEKLIARYKLGMTIQKVIADNVSKNAEGLITSLRKLAASSETEYSIIQKISSSKKDPQFSTLMAIIDGFGISFSEFAKIFDSFAKEDIDLYKRGLKEKSKKIQLPKSKAFKKINSSKKK